MVKYQLFFSVATLHCPLVQWCVQRGQLPVPPHGTLLTFCPSQLQGLWEHSTKVPSLFNPATHTFKMAQEADAATSGEGNLGTNVVWMFPKVESLSPRAPLPAGRLSSRVLH